MSDVEPSKTNEPFTGSSEPACASEVKLNVSSRCMASEATISVNAAAETSATNAAIRARRRRAMLRSRLSEYKLTQLVANVNGRQVRRRRRNSVGHRCAAYSELILNPRSFANTLVFADFVIV
ncbi:hypothetical protein PI124_g5532 [Phytophthora idaei]|nr:hypothetical protein PI125_g4959 [Phytophthora idaei]KAG3163388.1 hypothetical protein PI126_g5565 [Phytophthora idaei]KAG3249814.1 hypothetical protein PI124_g5532 [Phytophthora idaei]